MEGKYLYGVYDNEIEQTEIIKETAKQFRVKKRITTYDYGIRVPKDHPMIAFSKEEAITKFVSSKWAEIFNHHDAIDRLKAEIEEAKQL